jgi:RNA polymerase sigma factor (sigma-70 family)
MTDAVNRPDPASGPAGAESSIEDIVRAAALGDVPARHLLVVRYHRVVWATARRFGLSDADTQDAVQNTWVRMLENLGSLRDADRLAGWLATTTHRECIKIARRSGREVVGLHPAVSERPDNSVPDPERIALDRAMRGILWHHVHRLPPSRQDLLITLVADEAMPYADYSRTAGMPVGSIGPIRMRSLRLLRRQLEGAGLDATAWR